MICRLAGAAPAPVASAEAKAWMQSALEQWEAVCRDQLHLPVDPVPWLIFYDESGSWQVNPDAAALPPHQPAGFALTFHGRRWEVFAVGHDEQQRIVVPDRPPVPARNARIFTAPYDQGRKSVVLCALPELAVRGVPGMPAAEFSRFLLGIIAHEIAHTRQVAAVDARFTRLASRYQLPESFDDNIVERTFGRMPAYTKLYGKELEAFSQAAFSPAPSELERTQLRQALEAARERRQTFFRGEQAAFAELDEVYLAMEGIGQWVHYQVLRRLAPPGETPEQTAEHLLKYTGSSWVQAEGFLMFLLLDRHQPGWQQRFFADDFPSIFAAREEATAERARP